jgi:iron complex outermembrane recepter protein
MTRIDREDDAVKTTLAAFTACASMVFAALVCAQTPPFVRAHATPRKYEINIERADVPTVLRAFSAQTGLQVGYLPGDPAEAQLQIGPLKDTLTAEEALARLLHPNGLAFKRVNARAIAVSSRAVIKEPLADPGQKDERGKPQDRPYLAILVPKPEPVFEERSADPQSIEDVLVPASRLRGGGQGPSLLMVFDRERLESLGIGSVADVLSYVPQQLHTTSEWQSDTGAQYANLRGLGVDATLILINGRRVAPTAASIAFNAVDLNLIPVSAIEKIEVLTDSGSVLHGTEAGGVINIVLKRTVPRPVVDVYYGAAEGGAEERRTSLQLGRDEGGLRGAVIVEYFEQGLLLGAERDLWRNQDFRRFGGDDWRSASANPGNVSALDGNLPGLSASFAAIPAGQAGAPLTTADFQATAGQRNSDSYLRFWSVVPEVHKLSASALAQMDVTSNIAASGELLYVDRQVLHQVEPATLSGAVVPAENPFNPFGTAVAVDYLFAGIGPRQRSSESRVLRTAVGVNALIGEWRWESSLLHSTEDALLSRQNDIDFDAVRATLGASDPTHALNVFERASTTSTSFGSLLAEAATTNFSSTSSEALSILRGPAFQLPAGRAQAAVAGEWRSQSVRYLDSSAGTRVSHDRVINAASLQLQLPLANAEMSLPGIDELSLTAAGRLDHYNDSGQHFNPQYRLDWRPSSSLLVQASYATSFRAQSQFDLHLEKVTLTPPLRDPRRHNEVVNVPVTVGGNPDLAPVESRSFSAGLTYTPKAVDPLLIRASYWRVNVKNGMSVVSPFVLLADEQHFADRVVRADPTAADIAAGLPGRLESVNSTRMNLASIEARGISAELSYARETRWGRFNPQIAATWMQQFEAGDLPETMTERVGIVDVMGTVPRWRAVARMRWGWQAFELSTAVRYVSGHDDAVLGVRTGRKIPAEALVDLQAVIDLSNVLRADVRHGFELTVGAANLFDQGPHFSAGGLDVGYDPSQGDLRQRFTYVRVSKAF